MRSRRFLSAAFALGVQLTTALGPAATAADEAPVVTRPRYEGADEATSGPVAGTVFFLATPRGAVAVGAAHSFDRAKLAAASELVFELARSRKQAATATRMLIEPGLPFSAPGGSLRTDIVAFALEAPPTAARVLEPGRAPKEGDRVRVLGIPANNPHDEDDIFGTVESVAADRIEVLLDVFYDLRGWGGAPVLSHPEGRALAFIQAATPDGRRLRVTATPIDVVVQKLAHPPEGGRGRTFASLAKDSAKTAAREPKPTTPAQDTVVLEAPGAPKKKVVSGALTIEIEHPSDGAIFGDPLGALIAGRAADDVDLPKIEVVFVLDTSGSTSAPSGMDVNGNGVVGDAQLPMLGSVFGIGSTDPGDSILAAEVAAARQFLARLDPRYTRVCLVSYAGRDIGTEFYEQIDPDSVLTEVPLTSEYKDVERALSRVLSRGPGGLTYMSGGVDQATAELLGLKGSFSTPDRAAEKLVVFLTDGQPTMPRDAKPAVIRAARRAKRAGIRVFTYGIGEEALSDPSTLTQLAEMTRGTFTPVRDARKLGDLVAQVDLAGIAAVTLRNKTTGQPAHAVELASDGGFGAMVPLAPGKNEIVVTATGTDGRVATKSVTVQYAPGAQSPSVPSDLLARRNRLLEERLIQLKRTREQTEDSQAEEVRKQLEVEIEQTRAQRKDLELKVQKNGDAKTAPTAEPAPKP